MDDVQVRNNTIWTVKSGLVIGTEVASHSLTNVIFDGNDVIHADRGISMNCYFGGTIINPRWTNNHFEFIGGNIKQMLIEIKIRDEEGLGHIRDVAIENNSCEKDAENRSRIEGLDLEHSIDGVTIENLTIAGSRRHPLEDARIDATRFARDVTIK